MMPCRPVPGHTDVQGRSRGRRRSQTWTEPDTLLLGTLLVNATPSGLRPAQVLIGRSTAASTVEDRDESETTALDRHTRNNPQHRLVAILANATAATADSSRS